MHATTTHTFFTACYTACPYHVVNLLACCPITFFTVIVLTVLWYTRHLVTATRTEFVLVLEHLTLLSVQQTGGWWSRVVSDDLFRPVKASLGLHNSTCIRCNLTVCTYCSLPAYPES
jgi:hypothetical protein